MFPEELPHRLIKMFSFAGETVLDPFLGSGTTSKAAMNLGRNSIGYEINPDNRSLMESKLSGATGLTFAQDPGDSPARPLPYRFVDPLKLDKAADLKQVRFGSKLDSTDTGREELLRVKEILSATRLRLSNDAVIELLGVTTRPEQEEPAMQYLRETLKNEQIFIRHENVLAGEQRQSRVYLYLKNRTFINARLIKQGLADLDESYAGGNTALLKLSGQHVR
jgi:site-specific DNA-methyltransferase (adenine-specific)